MKKTILFLLIFQMLASSVYAEILNIPKKMYVLTHIAVTSPPQGAKCAMRMPCPIEWNTNNIKNYNMVWLEIVWPDGTPTSGAYPVPNTGKYEWIPDESFYDPAAYCKDYRAKVYTNDNKYKGMSGTFKVGKFFGMGCPP